MSFRIELSTSRSTLFLEQLEQVLTYQGLIEGLPTTEMNERRVKHALEKATALGYGRKPYLIQPTETPLVYRGGEEYPFGNPARVPAVTCYGVFRELSPVRDRMKDYSTLVIVWFQEDFALPLAPEIENHIKALDWVSLAYDLEL